MNAPKRCGWRLPLCILTALCLSQLSACATLGQSEFHTTVDSLAIANAKEKRTFIVLPGNKGITTADLEFQEYSADLIRVLGTQGFVSVKDDKDADIAIVLSYGVGKPQIKQYNTTLPVWGQTDLAWPQGAGDSSLYPGAASYAPPYDSTAPGSSIGTEISYLSHAVVTGYDFKVFQETRKQVQVWKTTIMSSGFSGDLRRVFPILVSAAAPYFASNTGAQVPVRLHESDPLVRIAKGEAAAR